MTAPLDPVFASTFMYSACKVVGADQWDAWRVGTMASLEALDRSEWAGFRTLGQLARVCTFDAFVDASTYIDRARCVAAGHFLLSTADVWVTIDDDIDASEDVLRRLVRACRSTRRGVAVPYMNRDGKSMTFRAVRGPTISAGPDILLRTVDRVGFGLVALHRSLVEELAARVPDFRESDKSAVRCPALFCNGIDGGTWMGEDYFFSKLAEQAGYPLRVLLCAPIAHAGLLAQLDTEGAILVADPLRAGTLEMSLRAKEAACAPSPCPNPPSQGE